MKQFLLSLALLLTIAHIGWAQTKSVSGTVTDKERGEPIIGATVVVDGTIVGSITDVDGKYSITNLPEGAKALKVSYVGMKTLTVPISGSKMDVQLASDVGNLDEVLVVAYGTSTKGSFTGSVGVMKAEAIETRQVSNVSNALSGAVAGVQVLNDNGQPGTSGKIRIRGVGSINAGTNPLYIVDGVPLDGDLRPQGGSGVQSTDVLSSINPSDIESVTVLKDAASTSLYGARGANGIVMITTKKGSKGKAKINFDMKLGMNSRAINNYDVFTSADRYTEKAYQAIYNAGIYNLGYTPEEANKYANETLIKNEEGGYGYQIYTLPSGESLIGMDGKINSNAKLGYSDGKYYYTPDNWGDETFSNNPRQEYNLSMSGGTAAQNYYISLGYLNDQGIIDGSGFERISGRFKGEQQLKDWLKVSANVNYSNSESSFPRDQNSANSSSSGNAFFIANFIAPVYPMYVRDPESNEIMQNGGRNVYDYGDGVSTNSSRSFMQIANPAGDLMYNKARYLSDMLQTSAYAEITPLKGLTLTARYGFNLDNTRYDRLGNAYMGQSAQYGGTATFRQTRITGFNQQYIANYLFTIKEKHNIDITAGYDGYSYAKLYADANGQNLYNPDNFYLDNVIDNKTAGGNRNTYATEGFFTRVNYSLRDTYFANASFRRDASSRFSPDNRWGNFWSASAAWMISNEEFMSDATWIDMLKLKASYGQQGNDDVGNFYAWQDQYSVTGADGVFSDGTLYYKGNPNLTWETSSSYNIGVDYAFLRNRLSGSVEYFGRKSSDMLYYKPVAGSVGYTKIPMNIGSMTNSGLELNIIWNIMSKDNFNWDFNVNATTVRNKINKLSEDLGGSYVDGSYIYEEGESRYRMFLVDYAGVDEETGEALYWSEDKDGNKITTNDYATAQSFKIGTDDLMPDIYGGFGTTVRAYGFDASVQCSYQLGGKIYDSGYARLMHGGASSNAGTNWHNDIANAWTPENTITDIPRLNANDKYSNSTSTRWLTSSNYLSLNNITLGYTLPTELVERWQIAKIRVYFSADNVALLSSRKGLDPRQSYTTATTATYSPIRTLSGGINLTF
ncbi:MAG: SusC/RagA family TonB-linked outer membrane protein [Bacteroidales bacterium]